MHAESIVYGYIKDLGDPQQRSLRSQLNSQVTSQLPEYDGYSYLNREMFSLPRQGEDAAIRQASYLIPFGACYDGIEYEWRNWLQTFEVLLKQMYWTSAVVHLETELSGKHSFVWQLDDGEHRPGDDIRIAHMEWVHDRF